MPHRRPVGADSIRHLRQESIAHFTGCLFQGEALPGLVGPDITPLHSSWQVQPMRHVGNISGIGLRFIPPQLVVKVSHMEGYAQLLAQLVQDMEQADRIRAAGHSHHQLLIFWHQVLIPDKAVNSLR